VSAVRVHGVWKAFGDRSVLERVSLDVAAGSFVTMVGASGCGKTTFLRLLLGVEAPSRGRITVDGEPLRPEPGRDRGIVFQRYSVFPHLTVLGNVVLGLEFARSKCLGRLHGQAKRAARDEAAAVLADVGLGQVIDAWPTTLSGGMQQRLAIAQAVILKPRILLLDEPFGALDPGIRNDMHGLITRLWRETGMTVFMVTHDIGEAFKLGTRVLTFDRVRRDPQAPDAYGASITYDLVGYNRKEAPAPWPTATSAALPAA
jgi:NitT/TauT family transport system ATP-binding protein